MVTPAGIEPAALGLGTLEHHFHSSSQKRTKYLLFIDFIHLNTHH